ncbi:unnamed protein product [Rangifer tarandus platyrhynchus]|uniref:Uncharacterized protein n=2 Tax=Rangifer tarandus platyrhynchus TaxID=3082113 RepID=A0ABN8YE21_RANTA|nr:unnamed protein product [Rangifer tarandus platyrhynchus]
MTPGDPSQSGSSLRAWTPLCMSRTSLSARQCLWLVKWIGDHIFSFFPHLFLLPALAYITSSTQQQAPPNGLPMNSSLGLTSPDSPWFVECMAFICETCL